jgi:VanZ family protein
VHWLGNQNGLGFDRYGTLLSSRHFEVANSDVSSCSVELWLKPARTWGKGTVLAFYNPLNGRQFSLRQDYINLALHRDTDGSYSTNLYVEDVFRKEQALITVTSDGQSTAVYIDGDLAARSSGFTLFLNDLRGQLIVATSPLQSNSWSGRVQGLAIYKSELSKEQVAQHYQDWMQKGKPAVEENEPTLALYLFDEHTGKIIHNQIRSGMDLYIPDRYVVVHQTLLESPWKELQTQQGYLENAFVNVAGFIPLGVVFGAYFISVRRIKAGVLATIVFGAMVSLTIEVLQSYLPTRDSGFTDVMTNTLGTGVGVMLYRLAALPLARVLAARHRSAFGIAVNWGSQENKRGRERIGTFCD